MPPPDSPPEDRDPETLSRLAGGLAHELKNPLGTLGLHLSLLEEDWRDDDSPRARRSLKTLENLRRQVAAMNAVLDDFLRYARTDVLHREPVELGSLVEDVALFVRPELEARGIQLQVLLEPGLPPVEADPTRLRQALLNLVINARQAMEERGHGRVTLITRREGDHAVLEVVDDGPGMDADTLERSLEPYYSTKARGTGLGLPTVRRILEAHGGALELQSEPGRGTRAVLRLPLVPSSPAPSR